MSSSSEQWPPPPRDKHLTCFTETLLLLGGTNGRCARKLLGHFVYCLNLSLLALDPSRPTGPGLIPNLIRHPMDTHVHLYRGDSGHSFHDVSWTESK